MNQVKNQFQVTLPQFVLQHFQGEDRKGWEKTASEIGECGKRRGALTLSCKLWLTLPDLPDKHSEWLHQIGIVEELPVQRSVTMIPWGWDHEVQPAGTGLWNRNLKNWDLESHRLGLVSEKKKIKKKWCGGTSWRDADGRILKGVTVSGSPSKGMTWWFPIWDFWTVGLVMIRLTVDSCLAGGFRGT